VRVHINSLRRKLEDMAETPRYIETCIGHGYRLGTAKNLEETR
ncbi:MAG: winged helix-turn-helix domain-containing protein, partial [Chloroflexi bacterium]